MHRFQLVAMVSESKTSTQAEFVSLQTPLDDVPVAMEPFQGRLLVGVGRLLRIYDIGKKKMLRKCENKVLTAP